MNPEAERPLSPHLQIWAWTPTLAASITHRATGIALYTGTILLALWVFAVAVGDPLFTPVGRFLASPLGTLILFGYAWALLFHTLAGLRHLYWDTGRGLAIDSAKLTAWYVFAGSLVLAIAVVATGVAARAS